VQIHSVGIDILMPVFHLAALDLKGEKSGQFEQTPGE